MSPLAVSAADATRSRDGIRAIAQLAALSGDEVLDQPYVPVNLAALSGAGLSGEIRAQLSGERDVAFRRTQPGGGAWVDASSNLTQGDANNLASGLQSAGAAQTVVNDSDLASAGVSNYTFAQPFTLDLGHGAAVTAAAADSTLVRGSPPRPTIRSSAPSNCWPGCRSSTSRTRSSWRRAASSCPPPAGWHPSAAFMDALLGGLSPSNTALKAVTLSQLFAAVPSVAIISRPCASCNPAPPATASPATRPTGSRSTASSSARSAKP